MAGFWNTVLGFAKVKVPSDPQGDYQTGSILLRVFGWYHAVSALLVILMIPLILAILLVAVAAGSEEAGAALTPVFFAIVGIVMAFALLVGAAFGLVWLYWLGWILGRWANKDPRAIAHARVFGGLGIGLFSLSVVITIVFALLGQQANAATENPYGSGVYPWLGLFNPLGWLYVGALIWLLVLARRQTLQAAFAPAQAP